MTSTLDTDHPHKFNHRRLHDEIGLVPPAEYEDLHHRHTHHSPQGYSDSAVA